MFLLASRNLRHLCYHHRRWITKQPIRCLLLLISLPSTCDPIDYARNRKCICKFWWYFIFLMTFLLRMHLIFISVYMLIAHSIDTLFRVSSSRRFHCICSLKLKWKIDCVFITCSIDTNNKWNENVVGHLLALVFAGSRVSLDFLVS